MARCYRCGAADAYYRRTVYTGYSSNNWWSGKSSGHSSRVYHGVRSVCKKCAKEIDTWNTIKAIFGIAVVCIIIFSSMTNSNKNSNIANRKSNASVSKQYIEDAKIISRNGVNLRDKPNSKATILAGIPYNETVNIIDTTGDAESILGKTANWFQVDYNGTTGWVWSGFLMKINRL